MSKSLLLISCLFISVILNASEIDSLKREFSIEKSDSLKSRLCLKIGDYYEKSDVDQSINWGIKAVDYAKKTGDDRFIVRVVSYASTYYHTKGDFFKQIEESLIAYKLAEKNHYDDLRGGIASNIGSAYVKLNDSTQAIEWLLKSVDLKKKYSTKKKLAYSLTNLGTYYFEWGNYPEAIKYFSQGLEISKMENDPSSVSKNLGNLADCYLMLREYEKAEIAFFEAIEIKRQLNDKHGLGVLHVNLSSLYLGKEQYSDALKHVDSALNIAKQNSYGMLEHDALLQMADVRMKMNQKDLAFENLTDAYILWKELHKEEAAENLNELRTKYETDKLIKDGEIKDLELARNDAEISNQRIIIAASIGGLAIMLVMLYFLNKWNKDKRAQNTLLSQQKKLVETKNREILDSIQYAKRIQAAILPPNKLIKACFPQSFIFYQPKDVVAGDFYWIEKKNDQVIFAAADCTGHGVPGAMVSVVCNNGLNRSVREYGLTEPGKILDQTRSIVLQEFEKSDDEVSDGMDIALCTIANDQVQYAGAHNPLWLIRSGELIEIKANKQPIGKFYRAVEYTTHTLDLQTGDTIYLFTDGFADQFGGEHQKKYKSANFKKFLLSIQSQDMEAQLQLIRSEFNNWRGDLEQVDDVCIFGVRV